MQGLPQLTFIPLSGIDLVFVTAAGDPLAKKKEVTWDDLKQASWILNQEGCQFRAYIEKRLTERGQTKKIEVEIIGFELQKRLTQLGLGISLLPRTFVKKEIRQGSLKTLNVKGTKLQGYACLVLRKDKYVHGPMKAFLKLLEETFKPPKDALRKIFRVPVAWTGERRSARLPLA